VRNREQLSTPHVGIDFRHMRHKNTDDHQEIRTSSRAIANYDCIYVIAIKLHIFLQKQRWG